MCQDICGEKMYDEYVGRKLVTKIRHRRSIMPRGIEHNLQYPKKVIVNIFPSSLHYDQGKNLEPK